MVGVSEGVKVIVGVSVSVGKSVRVGVGDGSEVLVRSGVAVSPGGISLVIEGMDVLVGVHEAADRIKNKISDNNLCFMPEL
jgi:hypothetical protein